MFDFVLSAFQVFSEEAAVCGRAEVVLCVEKPSAVYFSKSTFLF